MGSQARSARSVRDRVAVVTGAASGMGRATATLLAAEGAAVAFLDVDGRGAEEAASEAERAGQGRAEAWAADVTDVARLGEVIGAVRATLGPVDIVVNNAGVTVPVGVAAEEFHDAWEATLATNLTAYADVVRACLDDLARNGDGRVVNIASTEALGATRGLSPYTVSKHGVVGLTRSLAVELGRTGVTVNCVCPGPIHTGMTALIPDDAKDTFARRRVPLGRYGEPEEVAHAILSLVLPAASYVTGAVLAVDGGLTAQVG